MAITGYLTEFSLAEIFQLLEQGRKTGLLSISKLSEVAEDGRNHYIWFKQGRIVGAAHTLDQQGLISLISHRGWLGDRAAFKLAQSCPIDTPIGLCLKSQGILQAEQLKLLFYTQVMRQVCALFELKDGWFQFDAKAPIPASELTGLSAPATEVTLAGLRALKDWSALQDKLPDPASSIISVIDGKPELKLNQVEWQVWEFTNGSLSLKAIAEQMRLSIEQIQHIAFRLVVVGLVEELPFLESAPAPQPSDLLLPTDSSVTATEASEATKVSPTFLQNLVGFLKGKL
ncbi:DUF4388 domain-containing protein [Oscillatoria sp. FACHB-1407]|uniref:DUF4388 domain-containing protein n=1 Tax=Oscillatoria sp. FACHB-1407 TaxID=2692847 RepID=UPI00168527D3|nr:DUF4388 domain-containing protein [Oscillatoria sp. FACHB-1407]MBD2460048.1 DUF4388 domain-containing protein [Oscillatoria sp. FACHB-1407]